MTGTRTAVSFAEEIVRVRADGGIVVQPRMGMSNPLEMAVGLAAVQRCAAPTVGTITVDSFTRTGDLAAARRAVDGDHPLNGYPLATHPPAVTRRMLALLDTGTFPVQIRHGSPSPRPIIDAMCAVGLDATEGGPVSYCLPYGRVPLAQAIENWRWATQTLAAQARSTWQPHLESFGGCMMGQLCPPEMLVALTVLEAIFFRQHGMESVSVSLTQQTNPSQDLAALRALHRLGEEHLAGCDWHIVLYAYMGVFPHTRAGARQLLIDATHLAVDGGAHRIIVKTPAEATKIPTIRDNVEALELAAQHTACDCPPRSYEPDDGQLLARARRLVEATLELSPDVGQALHLAFRRGLLDVPYCLHPDNPGRARSTLDPAGRIVWAATGQLPLPRAAVTPRVLEPTSTSLLDSLTTIRRRYDNEGEHR